MISNRQWRQEDHFVGGPATKNGLHHCPAKAALSILCLHPFWQCRELPSDILISQELPIPCSSFLAKLGSHAGHFVWDTHDLRCFCFSSTCHCLGQFAHPLVFIILATLKMKKKLSWNFQSISEIIKSICCHCLRWFVICRFYYSWAFKNYFFSTN